MMHGLVGGGRTKPRGHIFGDFVEDCRENVDSQDGSDGSGLKENVLHCLSIFCNTWFSKRSWRQKVNDASDKKKLEHVIIELCFRFTSLILTRFHNNGLRILLNSHHLSMTLLHKAHWIKCWLTIHGRLGGASIGLDPDKVCGRGRGSISQRSSRLTNGAWIPFEKAQSIAWLSFHLSFGRVNT